MSEYIDRPLDWDDEISAESSFTLLPAGEYPFTVLTFERAFYNGGDKLPACPKAELTIEVDGGAAGKAVVRHNLFISRKTEGILCEFFIAIGQKKHGEPLKMNWQTVPGSTGRCKLGIRTYNDNEYNEIKKFLEPQSAAPALPKFPAPGSNG